MNCLQQVISTFKIFKKRNFQPFEGFVKFLSFETLISMRKMLVTSILSIIFVWTKHDNTIIKNIHVPLIIVPSINWKQNKYFLHHIGNQKFNHLDLFIISIFHCNYWFQIAFLISTNDFKIPYLQYNYKTFIVGIWNGGKHINITLFGKHLF